MPRTLLLSFAVLLAWGGGVPAHAEERVQPDRNRPVSGPPQAWPTSIAIPAGPPPADAPRLVQRSGGLRAPAAIPRTRSRWEATFDGAYLHQMHTTLDAGNGYAANRILSRLQVRYRVKPKIPLTLSFGYRFDQYDFDGGGSAAFPGHPWSYVHSPRITLPFFVPLGERWFVVGGFTLRSTVEQGAPLDEGITWGGFFGASYKVSDRLSIGPGFGYLTEIEDAASLFPVIIIDWKIRPNLTLRTGQGVGSTQGPGLFLDWRINNRWLLSGGGRSERLRFRLDEEGVAPGGVGEDASFAAVLFLEYKARDKLTTFLSVGVNFEGTLTVDDRDGVQLFRKGYDSAGLLGFGLAWTF